MKEIISLKKLSQLIKGFVVNKKDQLIEKLKIVLTWIIKCVTQWKNKLVPICVKLKLLFKHSFRKAGIIKLKFVTCIRIRVYVKIIKEYYVYIIIIGVPILLYCIPFYMNVPSYSFEDKSLSLLIENRIRDMSTTFVLSISIIIFALNSIKELNLPNYKYKELIKSSYLFPLISFLSINLMLTIISSINFKYIKDCLDQSLIHQLITLIYVLFVFNILAIMIVFFRVFKLTDPEYLINRDIKNYDLAMKKGQKTAASTASMELLLDFAIKKNDLKLLEKIINDLLIYEKE